MSFILILPMVEYNEQETSTNVCAFLLGTTQLEWQKIHMEYVI